MESTEITTKSSNEILTELFGAFNAEPPKIKLKTKRRSSSEGTDSKHSRKSKKSKSKKSKKKHKSKSKKHKRKRTDDDSESESISIRKKKKHKKKNSSPSVNIELPVNKVPMALEIMLDGTVGIKGEDGVITKIPDVAEDKTDVAAESENIPESNGVEVVNDNIDATNVEKVELEEKKTDTKQNTLDLKVPQVFDVNESETGDKIKKGKIQIKDLKFSSVFQETVKAVEEQKKKEEEKKANYEEGELSDSSEDEQDNKNEDLTSKSKTKSEKEYSKHRHRSHSKSWHKKSDHDHSGKKKRRSRSRSCSTSRHKSHHRHHSHDRSNRNRHRSRSKEENDFYSSKNSHRRHSRSSSSERIYKDKLLAIAHKNALKSDDAGVTGAKKAGGKTISEFTEYCKKLSEKEALGEDVSDIESDFSDVEEKAFQHPFQPVGLGLNSKDHVGNSLSLRDGGWQPVKSLENYMEGNLEKGKKSSTERSKSKSDREHSKHRHSGHHLGKKKRSSRSRSNSSSRQRSHARRHSRDRSSANRHRSRSRDRHGVYTHRRRSSSIGRSQHSSGRTSSPRSRSRSHRSRSPDRKKSRSSHRSKSKDYPPGKGKDRSTSIEKIDKEKLLAIARKNALKLIDAGVVPGAEKLTTIKAGGKTVNELTEYCKKLSEKEALGEDVSDIESESSEDEEKPFHHPFQVKDRPSSIIMNIKNSIPLPVKSLQEKAAEQAKQLRLQFPVSSGSSHRRTESEWVPVSPKKEESSVMKTAAVPPMPVVPPLPMESHPVLQHSHPPTPMYLSAVPPPQPPNKPVFPIIQPNPPMSKLDISSIVSKRLEAIRKLQENPNDSQALNQMYSAQQEMQYWAESKQETGAFTGSTGAKVLSAAELNSGVQAWAKRDQLTSATPVRGGMGMALLQKMGWQPGEGLGKNKEGTLEPLRLEVKMNKKGLLAADENRKKKGPILQPGPPLPTVKTLDGKHPVSLLNELCSRRRYGVPQFELCFECGPDHKKNFLFKVKVNGIEYTPNIASPNKKQAKAEAAAICLRALGIISNNPQN